MAGQRRGERSKGRVFWERWPVYGMGRPSMMSEATMMWEVPVGLESEAARLRRSLEQMRQRLEAKGMAGEQRA